MKRIIYYYNLPYEITAENKEIWKLYKRTKTFCWLENDIQRKHLFVKYKNTGRIICFYCGKQRMQVLTQKFEPVHKNIFYANFAYKYHS
jgi:hypothetical protein